MPESSRRRKWIFIMKWINRIIKLDCITGEERIGNTLCMDFLLLQFSSHTKYFICCTLFWKYMFPLAVNSWAIGWLFLNTLSWSNSEFPRSIEHTAKTWNIMFCIIGTRTVEVRCRIWKNKFLQLWKDMVCCF